MGLYPVGLLYFYIEYLLLTLLVTKCVGFFPHKSPSAARCLIVQLSSDTVYLEIDLSLVG